MIFSKDTRWDIFLGCQDWESFKENIVPKIYLKSDVPSDIKNSFKIIEKLLLHSYYEYEFFDVVSHTPYFWTILLNQFSRFSGLFTPTKVANASFLSRASQVPRSSEPLTKLPLFALSLWGK